VKTVTASYRQLPGYFAIFVFASQTLLFIQFLYVYFVGGVSTDDLAIVAALTLSSCAPRLTVAWQALNRSRLLTVRRHYRLKLWFAAFSIPTLAFLVTSIAFWLFVFQSLEKGIVGFAVVVGLSEMCFAIPLATISKDLIE
jgi:hypothetical protein